MSSRSCFLHHGLGFSLLVFLLSPPGRPSASYDVDGPTRAELVCVTDDEQTRCLQGHLAAARLASICRFNVREGRRRTIRIRWTGHRCEAR